MCVHAYVCACASVAHVDYLLVVSPGKLTHSQAKVNKSRKNSYMKEEVCVSVRVCVSISECECV